MVSSHLRRVVVIVAVTVATVAPAAGASTDLHASYIDLPMQRIVDANDHHVVFSVREAQLGEDLNGNGSTFDEVFHVADPDTGLVHNLGITALFAGLVDDFLVYTFHEAGVDVNGDGDIRDSILGVVDLDGNVSHVPNLATRVRNVSDLVVARSVMFPVHEGDQGGQDLNGDGDALDWVIHELNVDTGEVTNHGLVTALLLAADSYVVFGISESTSGSDLDGDGDLLDVVTHVYFPQASELINLAIPQRSLHVSGDVTAIGVSESGLRTDLNGDGDNADTVIHTYDPQRGLTNTALAVETLHQDVNVLDDGSVAFAVPETGQAGTDLNGDGDIDDTVVHVVDYEGVVTNVGLAGFALRTDKTDLGFVADELASAVDLNGDGDTSDLVPQVYAQHDASLLNSRQALFSSALADEQWGFSETMVVVATGEAAQGADLNSDGDTGDSVVNVVDRSTGDISNLGVASKLWSGFALSGTFAAYQVSERASGETDLNGDGDHGDNLGFVYLRGVDQINLGHDISLAAALSDELLVYGAQETTLLDLNDDGKTWTLPTITRIGLNAAPIASAGPDQVVEATYPTTSVTLDGSGSTDPDGGPLTYSWTGGFAGGTAGSVSPVVAFSELGDYEITLVVSDGEATDADTVVISVVDTSTPQVTAALLPAGKVGPNDGTFEVDYSCSDTFDQSVSVTAELNAVPVEDGQVVKLKLDKENEIKTVKGDQLFLVGPQFELVVTCSDSSGNLGVAVAEPEFAS